jgi:hypothetical protein
MKPKWKQGQRFQRSGEISVRAAAGLVFPLLCPVREYEWIPDWRCTMVYSESGLAEKDAVFITPQKLHRTAVWTLITFEPPRLVEYLLVMGTDATLRLSVSLEEQGGATHLTWRFLFTAISRMAQRMLPVDFSEEKFKRMLSTREQQLRSYFADAGTTRAQAAGVSTG